MPKPSNDYSRPADGTLRQITIAPEHDGAAEAIARFTDVTSPSPSATRAPTSTRPCRVRFGRVILTHAFNGMHASTTARRGP